MSSRLLEVNTQHVWDYAGNGYVHRLRGLRVNQNSPVAWCSGQVCCVVLCSFEFGVGIQGTVNKGRPVQRPGLWVTGLFYHCLYGN